MGCRNVPRVVIAAIAAVTATCSTEQLPEATIALTPTASVPSDAFTSHIAAISDDIACVPDTREFQVVCYDRSGKVHGVWGRMTVFEPTGRIVAEMRVRLFLPRRLGWY